MMVPVPNHHGKIKSKKYHLHINFLYQKAIFFSGNKEKDVIRMVIRYVSFCFYHIILISKIVKFYF